MKKPIATVVAAAGMLAATFLAPDAQADETVIVCPGGRSGVATSATSCGFAQNVRSAYFAQRGPVVLAYSPTTGEVYSMQCGSGFQILAGYSWVSAARCVGGFNAVVWVW